MVDDVRRSALVVPVPEAEPVVGRWRRRLDPSADLGVPAHITVLYPFIHPSDIDRDVIDAIAELSLGQPAFDFELRSVQWFGSDVVWIEPHPDTGFRALTAEVVRRWPDHRPYEGVYDDVVPHLTVADGAAPSDLRTAAIDVAGRLPIMARANELCLMVGAEASDTWTQQRSFALGAP